MHSKLLENDLNMRILRRRKYLLLIKFLNIPQSFAGPSGFLLESELPTLRIAKIRRIRAMRTQTKSITKCSELCLATACPIYPHKKGVN